MELLPRPPRLEDSGRRRGEVRQIGEEVEEERKKRGPKGGQQRKKRKRTPPAAPSERCPWR